VLSSKEESLEPERCTILVGGRTPSVVYIGTKVNAAAAVIGHGAPVSWSGRGIMQQDGGVVGHFNLSGIGGHGTRSPGNTSSIMVFLLSSFLRPKSYSSWAAGRHEGWRYQALSNCVWCHDPRVQV
jgi:hypothetical protein